MNELGLKEKAVLAILGVIALYVIAVVLWFTNCEAAWNKAARTYQREAKKLADEDKLISERVKWNDAYEEEKALMPIFESGKATDTVWLRKVDDLARSNLVVIAQIDHGEEIAVGDVLELPIEIKSFESSLEALVKFMYALENSTEGMYDIKAMNVKPGNKPGYLKGSMSLNCAYMRED